MMDMYLQLDSLLINHTNTAGFKVQISDRALLNNSVCTPLLSAPRNWLGCVRFLFVKIKSHQHFEDKDNNAHS